MPTPKKGQQIHFLENLSLREITAAVVALLLILFLFISVLFLPIERVNLVHPLLAALLGGVAGWLFGGKIGKEEEEEEKQ